MTLFDILAEAKIRQWQREGEKPGTPRTAPAFQAQNLETQLYQDIIGLTKQLEAEHDVKRRETLQRHIDQLTIRLLVLLENTERPLAAKHMTKVLQRLGNEQKIKPTN